MLSPLRNNYESAEKYLLPKECRCKCDDIFEAAEQLKFAAERLLALKKNEIEI